MSIEDRYASYLNLIEQVDSLVTGFEDHPDPITREQVIALLSGLDALHREGLDRLMAIVRMADAPEVLKRFEADPIVRILLGLYDLAELDLPQENTEPSGFVALDDVTLLPDNGEML